MENRITRAWNTFQEAWKSVTTQLQLEESNDFFDKYSLLMTLDGEIIERASVSVIHLESAAQTDTVIVLYENGVPRLEANDDLPYRFPRLESRFSHLYEQGRTMQLRDALAAEGIVIRHMTIHNDPRKWPVTSPADVTKPPGAMTLGPEP